MAIKARTIGKNSADLMNLARHDLGFSKTEKRFPMKGTCLAIYSRTFVRFFDSTPSPWPINQRIAPEREGCTMAVLGRLGSAHGPDRSVSATASAAGRLLRAYATQAETLLRLRSGGTQVVRVERVNMNEGGQAVIAAVAVDRTRGRDD